MPHQVDDLALTVVGTGSFGNPKDLAVEEGLQGVPGFIAKHTHEYVSVLSKEVQNALNDVEKEDQVESPIGIFFFILDELDDHRDENGVDNFLALPEDRHKHFHYVRL